MLTPMRKQVDAMTLHALIDTEVAKLLQGNAEFTAFTVTKLLQAQNPDIDISHYEVRARVHNRMGGPFLTWGQRNTNVPGWFMRAGSYNGETATTYVPYPNGVIRISASQVPVIAPAPKPAQLPSRVLLSWNDNNDD